MALLELENVCKDYGSGAGRSVVLRNIDLSVERGEFVAIVGYSGAGKTTLVSLVAGLIAPDAGSVRFAGQHVREPGPERGVVFQNYSLLPWLSVFDNVALGVNRVFSQWSEQRRREHTQRYVGMVGLKAAMRKKPAQLSGGMRQRVALARALAMEPEMLLLDEPLGALDALTRATLQRELARICEESGKTILLITNDVDEGILLADRILPLGAGPAASLGPSICVDIARPRDRKELNHDERFKALRGEVVEYLLASGAKRKHKRAAQADPQMLGGLEMAR